MTEPLLSVGIVVGTIRERAQRVVYALAEQDLAADLVVKINAMLGKRMSLEQIAEKLNVEKVPTIHGTNRWTAVSVRKVFVS